MTTLSRLSRTWISWWPTLLAVLVVFSFRAAVADWYDVPSGSMQPTLLEGDRIACDKTAYHWRLPLIGTVAQRSDPERGDVVVFPSPTDGTRLVKRIVAIPGDVVELRNNRLYLDGEPAAYQPGPDDIPWKLPQDDVAPHVYLRETVAGIGHAVMLTPGAETRSSFGPVRIPTGKYLMMGDNRDNSADSRWFGTVDRDAIEGKVLGTAFSLDKDRLWRPRWDRFLRGLS
jgi:signal peptidase I